MKSILLTTTAIVAFAGAAVADGHTGVGFSGSATLGYNDDAIGDNDGFYWDGNVAVSMSAALDNGVTASAVFDFDFVEINDDAGSTDTLGQILDAGGFVLSLETETAGLFFGDTEFAAVTQWKSAGDMEADGFSEADGEVVLRGDVMVAGVDASVSYALANNAGFQVGDDTDEDFAQLSLGASGDLGMFSFAIAYQEENEFPGYFDADGAGQGDNGDFNDNEIFGISAGTSFSGADITLAYASDQTADESSIGVQVAYPFGPVTATVYYVAEDDGSDEDNYGATVAYSDGPIAVTLDYDYDQGTNKVGLDGSYDTGLGLTILAGMFDQSDSATATDDGTDYYVAGVYDLGGGAELLVSYADAETGDAIGDDEVGGPDYQVGTTVAVSFSF